MTNNTELERRLWKAADELRANSGLRGAQYSMPVLGLIFLRYADVKFQAAEEQLREDKKEGWVPEAIDYQASGVMYLPPGARWQNIMDLPESAAIGQEINEAMRAIEEHNPDLKGVLPKSYHQFQARTLWALLRNFNSIPMDIEGDAFGKIYEYFLGNFAMAEGQRGGEFFTPASLVRLIVEVIEPYEGRIYDPACGSGGMFVQSARFVEEHSKDPGREISIYGQERIEDTVKLCKMNLAVHGLAGDVKQANTYYEDVHDSIGKFDFVMANPPFNVNNVDKDRLKDDPRFPFGIPTVDNANYLWMQIFFSALTSNGRAGYVMANSAVDARGSELEIRKRLVTSGAVDVMINVAPNFFYTVTLPCIVWFLAKDKATVGTDGTVLMIDAKNIYDQIDRAHRQYTPQQVELLSNIVRLYRGQDPEYRMGSESRISELFPRDTYGDVPGLCKAVKLDDIEKHDWSLNPGRYVGINQVAHGDTEFSDKFQRMKEELNELFDEANLLEEEVKESLSDISETS